MFAIRLKQLREDAGFSQAMLARKLGVGQSTVGMWENGQNKPQNAKLEMLASIFHVSTDYLLGRTEESRGADEVAVSDIDFALHDEMRELSENGKMDLLKFARFIHEQEMKAKAAHDD